MKTIFKLVLLIVGITGSLFLYALIEPYWIQVQETTIQDRDIPASFNNFKVVFITDIHHSPSFSRERVRKAVQKVNSLNPDLILLGGDYAEESIEYLKNCFSELEALQAPFGKYGVLGNHEYLLDANLSFREMQAKGIPCLDNKGVWIERNGERIRIGGVGELWNDSQKLENVLEGVDEEDFAILLSHNPDYIERMSSNMVDLMLSGHTHGGQVTFFHFWAPVHPSSYGQKYISGLVQTSKAKVLISNGIGVLDGRPLRFFARPQINVIYLKNSEQI